MHVLKVHVYHTKSEQNENAKKERSYVCWFVGHIRQYIRTAHSSINEQMRLAARNKKWMQVIVRVKLTGAFIHVQKCTIAQ